MANKSDPDALRQWHRGAWAFGGCIALVGVGIAIAGAFTKSGPSSLGGPGLYFMGGGFVVAGIAIAAVTDYIGRRSGVRFPERNRFGQPITRKPKRKS